VQIASLPEHLTHRSNDESAADIVQAEGMMNVAAGLELLDTVPFCRLLLLLQVRLWNIMRC
jgi:hypothetical protein